MFTALLCCTLALIALLARSFCTGHGRIYINPMFGFLSGLIYYVVLPSCVIAYFSEEMSTFVLYSHELSLANATFVMGFTLASLATFAVGAYLIRMLTGPAPEQAVYRPAEAFRSDVELAALVLTAATVLFFLLSFSIRQFLFMGYDSSALENETVWALRGAMSSFYSLIYVCIVAIVLFTQPRLRSWRALLLFISFAGSTTVLLSLGARLYVAAAFLCFLALYSVLKNGIPAFRLAIFIIGTAALFGSVGVLRSSSSAGLASVLLNIMLEPLLTSISLFTLVNNNATIWVGQAHLFLLDFQALMPSFLFPEKAGLFTRLETDYGYTFEAPVGGFHLLFSALINFGVLGTVALAIPFGAFIANLSGMPTRFNRLSALMSIALTGVLVFTFFRDPFFISVVKNLVGMSILLPIFLSRLRFWNDSVPRHTSQTT